MLKSETTQINTLSSQFKDLNEFLVKHSTKNALEGDRVTATHTRIGNKELNIYGGSYIIPEEDLKEFYALYYEHVFVKKRKEYLTERQLDNSDCSIVVDFDFRYSHEVQERIHTKENIYDMISYYLDELKEYFVFKEDIPFNVFIFEKPSVNRLSDKSITKDGIHMMIGLKMDHIMQSMLREKMITKLPEIWELPLLNDYEAVLDEGITKGTTNWQLYGSRKPDNEAYELKYHLSITYDNRDGEFMMDELKVQDFDIKSNFYKLSVKNTNIPKFEINPKILNAYNSRLENKKSKQKKRNAKVRHVVDDANVEEEEEISLNDISNYEQLQSMMDIVLQRIRKQNPMNYNEIYETHLYTQALPPKYFEPGSHLLNRKVAFALKDTDNDLFLSWIMLRSKASDFDYGTIPKLYEDWTKYFNVTKSGLNCRSIMYWCKQDNIEEYQKINESTIGYYIEEVIDTQTDHDMACVFKKLYKDTYVCVRCTNSRGDWYMFKSDRWVEDKMISIQLKMSKEVHALFSKWREKYQEEYHHCNQNDDTDKIEYLKKKIKTISDLMGKLKTASCKKNYLSEAVQLFYDGEFLKRVDTNRDLVCFKNGVIDFSTMSFRRGNPQDYITKCTNIDYLPYDVYKDKPEFKEKEKEILTILKQIFPIPNVYNYMMEHFAATLPTDKNQAWYIYNGSGSNGKSIVTDLMKHVLGDYTATVPVNLVTDKRTAIGGTSSEIMQLKNVRYAVMQELTKNAVVNEGVMKELTGGDPLQGRGLYRDSETFDTMFSLAVCTNNMPKINSLDDGTWRRIKKIDYISKFVDEGEEYDEETQYVYPKDKTLKEKLPGYAPIMASILVEIAYRNKGIIVDCEEVLESSRKYRMSQDNISKFIKEMVVRTNNKNDRIKKKELVNEFRNWFASEQGGNSAKMPSGEELYVYMEKKFGVCKKNIGWSGVKILYPDIEDDVDVADDNL